jgi:hypothetical protein
MKITKGLYLFDKQIERVEQSKEEYHSLSGTTVNPCSEILMSNPAVDEERRRLETLEQALERLIERDLQEELERLMR